MLNRPLTKVTAKDKFELMYRIRKKEKNGWKRGKIMHDVNRFKEFYRHKGKQEYAGDKHLMKWVCYMYKDHLENIS